MHRNARALSGRLALIYEACLLSVTCTAGELSYELQTKGLSKWKMLGDQIS